MVGQLSSFDNHANLGRFMRMACSTFVNFLNLLESRIHHAFWHSWLFIHHALCPIDVDAKLTYTLQLRAT